MSFTAGPFTCRPSADAHCTAVTKQTLRPTEGNETFVCGWVPLCSKQPLYAALFFHCLSDSVSCNLCTGLFICLVVRFISSNFNLYALLFVRLLGCLCFKQPLWGLFAWFNQWLGSALPFQATFVLFVSVFMRDRLVSSLVVLLSVFFFWPVSLPFAACPLVGLCVAVTRPCLLGVVSVSSLFTGPGTLCRSSQRPHFCLTFCRCLSHLSVCLSVTVCVSVSVSVRPSISHGLCVCVSVCPSVHQSRFVCLCQCLSVRPSVTVCVSVSVSVRPSISHGLCVCVSVCPSVHQSRFVCLCQCLSVRPSVTVCVSVSVSVRPSISHGLCVICLSVCLSVLQAGSVRHYSIQWHGPAGDVLPTQTLVLLLELLLIVLYTAVVRSRADSPSHWVHFKTWRCVCVCV